MRQIKPSGAVATAVPFCAQSIQIGYRTLCFRPVATIRDTGQVANAPTSRRHGEHPGTSMSTAEAQRTGVPATDAHHECQPLMADGA
jgi:hypothetical protein